MATGRVSPPRSLPLPHYGAPGSILATYSRSQYTKYKDAFKTWFRSHPSSAQSCSIALHFTQGNRQVPTRPTRPYNVIQPQYVSTILSFFPSPILFLCSSLRASLLLLEPSLCLPQGLGPGSSFCLQRLLPRDLQNGISHFLPEILTQLPQSQGAPPWPPTPVYTPSPSHLTVFLFSTALIF